ncbi:discoidin domain-containing protein [Actinopolymorpha sp. B11F2]|uniref:discoidin domain-containing protein n=1 Tax=Actinopolymorpha sp. B11F2 TaxID=3160862 RepID=UPI0032E38F67
MRAETMRCARPLGRRGRRHVLAGIALLVAALLPLSTAGLAMARPASGAGDRISLSSNVEQLSVRPCLPETIRLGITNNGSKAEFVDVTITAEQPLQASKPGVTTYVPAHSTVEVSIRISATIDAAAGTYDVGFHTGRSETLHVPITVVTSSPDTRCLPRENMTATATSAQASPDYGPRFAIDGTDTTMWHTQYSPVRDILPQAITLDLGGSYDIAELVYQPRTSGNLNGTITAYTIYGSADNQTFTELTEGTWAADRTRKTAAVDAMAVRYLRLEAREGVGGYGSAAEIVLYGKPA